MWNSKQRSQCALPPEPSQSDPGRVESLKGDGAESNGGEVLSAA